MQQVRDGIWHWTSNHPAWREGADWPRLVSSFAYDDGARLVLFDPLGIPEQVEQLAGERDAVIVLTSPWHHRDAEEWGPEHGVPIFLPPLDEGDPNEPAGDVFRAGDEPVAGIEARAGMEANDLVLWVPDARVIVVGDTLIDRGSGLEFPESWADKGVPASTIKEGLLPLLELPIEWVLATHGGPYPRADLERALRA